jgi:hypothetical protein
MIRFITYADQNMTDSMELCAESALKHGADTVRKWTREELVKTGFYYRYKSILDEPRGSGLWLWKPFLILNELREAKNDTFVIYSDAGVEVIDNLRYITDRTHEIFLFGNQWEHAHWCKRDVIEAIWPERRADFNNFAGESGCNANLWASFGKQVQASVICFKASAYSRWFVEQWLKFCCDKHLIDDSPSVKPNHPEFREHRHDQAILTTLAYRAKLTLSWWPASYNNGAFTYERGDYPDSGMPVLFNHHRLRNAEMAA